MSYLTYCLIGFQAAALLIFIGLAMLVIWIAAVEAYTAWFKRRCRRDPVFFARHVLGLNVTGWQAQVIASAHGVGKSHALAKYLRLARGYSQ